MRLINFHIMLDRSIQTTGRFIGSIKNGGEKHVVPTMIKINGSPTHPSKTGILIDAIGNAVAGKMSIRSETIALNRIGPEIMCGLTRPDVTAEGEKLLRSVENADLLIIGTPVYRAAYTGILKHFFDLVDRDAMRNRKRLSAQQVAVQCIEHQMRPLMSFFAIQTVTTGIYGLSEDFANGIVANQALNERIERAASEAVEMLTPSFSSNLQLVQ